MTLVRKYGEPYRPVPAGRERLKDDATVGGVSLTIPTVSSITGRIAEVVGLHQRRKPPEFTGTVVAPHANPWHRLKVN